MRTNYTQKKKDKQEMDNPSTEKFLKSRSSKDDPSDSNNCHTNKWRGDRTATTALTTKDGCKKIVFFVVGCMLNTNTTFVSKYAWT